MKVTRLVPRAIAEPGGRSYVVVEIGTDDGVVGFAETHAEPSPQVAVDRIKRELAPLLGMDPLRAVRLDEDLRRSGASGSSRAAANIACLDILGKATRAPVYEAIGGPTRHKVRAMAAVGGSGRARIREQLLAAKSEGFRAFSIPLETPAGMERGRSFFTDIREMMDELRSAAGEECDFVLDCGGRISPGEALSIADRMEDFHLLWMDEPCGDLSATAQASISRGSVTPVGFGRFYAENARFQDLLAEDGVDVLRPSVAEHGLTAIRKAAAIAETYYVAVAPYHRGGPIGAAAGVQVCAALPNSFVQETPFSTDPAVRKARAAISGWNEKPVDGFFALSAKPGLGLDINRDALEAYTAAR